MSESIGKYAQTDSALSDEKLAIEKLEKVLAAIRDLEGLPIAFGMAKQLSHTAQTLDGYIRIEKRATEPQKAGE